MLLKYPIYSKPFVCINLKEGRPQTVHKWSCIEENLRDRTGNARYPLAIVQVAPEVFDHGPLALIHQGAEAD